MSRADRKAEPAALLAQLDPGRKPEQWQARNPETGQPEAVVVAVDFGRRSRVVVQMESGDHAAVVMLAALRAAVELKGEKT